MSNGRPWTDADSATLRRMAQLGYTDGEIAATTGRHIDTVRRQRQAHQLDPSHRVDWWLRSLRYRIRSKAS